MTGKEISKRWRSNNRKRYNAYQRSYNRRKPEKYLLRGAKERAGFKDVPFSITEKDIVIPEFCPILGIRLHMSKGQHADNSPSLDRINPCLGYVRGNIAVISRRANTIKSDGTAEEHRRIAEFIDIALEKSHG